VYRAEIPAEVPERVDEVATGVVDAVFHVRKQLDAGLNEELYKIALGMELTKRGISFAREARVPVHYDGVRIGVAVPDFLLVNFHAVPRGPGIRRLVPPPR